MKFIPLLIILGGCALPAPLSILNYGKLGADTVSIIGGNKTTTDHIISGMTDKDCKTSRAFSGGKYCEDKKQDYIQELED